ncbi:MAG: acetyl-CoA carboxylase biotin carboxyl carrier protein [Kiloniellaceae bacterium]
MPLSYKEVAEILKIIDASDCEELVVDMDGARLVVRRHPAGAGAQASYSDGETHVEGSAAAFQSASAGAGGTTSGQAGKRGGTSAGPTEAVRADGMLTVRSPMVGTFYRAPSPQDPPFAEVGDTVRPGDPLCLIEVMKLFTTIEAEHGGRIVEIAAENGALVEHDQLLFVIEPA